MTIKNALKNIIRSPMRTVLIILIQVGVGLILIYSLITSDAVNMLLKRVEIPLKGYYKFNVEMPKLFEGMYEFRDLKYISPELSDNKYTDDFFAISFASADSDLISIKTKGAMTKNTDFTIIGIDNINYLQEFISGEKYLVSGKLPEKSEIIIDEQLAKMNSVGINDEINVFMENYEEVDTIIIQKTFTISGLYKNAIQPSENEKSVANIRNNTMYTAVDNIAENAYVLELYIKTSTPEKVLNSIDNSMISHFPLTLISVDNFNNARNLSVSDIRNMSRNINIFIFVSSVMILGLISFYIISKRRKEIGVLIALGTKKVQIIMQFFIETLIVFFISMIIIASFSFLFSDNFIDKTVSEINSNITADQFKNTDDMIMSQSNENIDFVKVKNDFMHILSLLSHVAMIIFITSVIAFSVTLYNILKLEIIKILITDG